MVLDGGLRESCFAFLLDEQLPETRIAEGGYYKDTLCIVSKTIPMWAVC